MEKVGRLNWIGGVGKLGRVGLVLLCLLFVVPSCRQASSQAIQTTGIDDGRQWKWDIELPHIDDSIPQQILKRKAYVVSYNRETLQPNWVAWRLTSDHTDGDVERPATAWHDDKEVPQPRAYYQDYKGLSDQGKRWNRGHMCPAGDNKWDSDAMYESFLMTNACPQNKALNSGVWNQIEIRCRDWAKQYGEIYIVCGPLFLNQSHDTIGQHRIAVPEAFFKVVACFDEEHPWGIAYICRNNEGFNKKDLYENSISEAERITGITFFPSVNESILQHVKESRGPSTSNSKRK